MKEPKARPQDLRARWRTRDGRDTVRTALESRGVSFDDLADRMRRPDADPFDLLVHLAWNASLATRRQRAGQVRDRHAEFLRSFPADARTILHELLDKYAEHGAEQLDDMRVLEVPPLSSHGSPVEIAASFDGVEQLREAVAKLADLLYAA